MTAVPDGPARERRARRQHGRRHATGATAPGTFLGSSDIEGFQAGKFIQILDNQAAALAHAAHDHRRRDASAASRAWPTRSPTDASPLRWFPGAISGHRDRRRERLPAARGYAIASPDSDLLDLAGLLGAYASVYALTDQANADVGGCQPALAYFDGDPFPAQNQTPTASPRSTIARSR